jgi:hypothetical protein
MTGHRQLRLAVPDAGESASIPGDFSLVRLKDGAGDMHTQWCNGLAVGMVSAVLCKPSAYHGGEIVCIADPRQTRIDGLRSDFFEAVREVVEMISNFP